MSPLHGRMGRPGCQEDKKLHRTQGNRGSKRTAGELGKQKGEKHKSRERLKGSQGVRKGAGVRKADVRARGESIGVFLNVQ